MGPEVQGRALGRRDPDLLPELAQRGRERVLAGLDEPLRHRPGPRSTPPERSAHVRDEHLDVGDRAPEQEQTGARDHGDDATPVARAVSE